MSQKISEVLYLKVGSVSTTKLPNHKRGEMVSAINKTPIASSYLTKKGFRDDSQGDLLHHGGENKALFFMCEQTYEKINRQFNNKFHIDSSAFFGENLLLSDITEDDICIGDILQIGDAKVHITQPRQPCWKLSANTQEKDMTNFIFNSGLTGFYAKVLQEGVIAQKDIVYLEKRAHQNLTIKNLNSIIVEPLRDESLVLEALACADLGKAFHTSLTKRYELLEKDIQFSYYHT